MDVCANISGEFKIVFYWITTLLSGCSQYGYFELYIPTLWIPFGRIISLVGIITTNNNTILTIKYNIQGSARNVLLLKAWICSSWISKEMNISPFHSRTKIPDIKIFNNPIRKLRRRNSHMRYCHNSRSFLNCYWLCFHYFCLFITKHQLPNLNIHELY